MKVPNFQEFMLPLLAFVCSKETTSPTEAKVHLAAKFNLSAEDVSAKLPSGLATVFASRVGWARTYLKKAGLIETPRRAVWQATDRGRQVLLSPPPNIDVRFLKQFPEFVQFLSSEKPATQSNANEIDPLDDTVLATPEEVLEGAHLKLLAELSSDVLERVKECTPSFFEQLVVDVLVRMGYGGSRQDAGAAVGGTGDGGIDGIIKEDRLGLDVIYVQAKRWQSVVGRPELQKFAGALQGHRARKGVFITTSSFTQEAKQYVSLIDSRIILIDGITLARLMIEHDIGVNTVSSYSVKRVDSDYFAED